MEINSMFSFCILALLVYGVDSKFNLTWDKCTAVKCDNRTGPVCGLRKDGKGFRLRQFTDDCQLKYFDCEVEEQFAYENVPMFYCSQAFKPQATIDAECIVFDCSHPSDALRVCAIKQEGSGFRFRLFQNKCRMWEYNCEHRNDKTQFYTSDFSACRDLKLFELDLPYKDNYGPYEVTKAYRPEDFEGVTSTLPPLDINNVTDDVPNLNKDHNLKLDKDTAVNSTIDDDDIYVLSDDGENESANNDFDDISNESKNSTNAGDDHGDVVNETRPNNSSEGNAPEKSEDGDDFSNQFKNLFVVRGSIRDLSRVNETIDRFFAATHVFDLPVKEANSDIEMETRRRLVKIAGPVKVYKPWVVIPKNITDDHDHQPTLNSCYHKCPRKCPPTYAPVCGVPGKAAREPSLMFQNHCYMDVAQCKMYWENKSRTARSSSYKESPFVFCLGLELSDMYSFLPLVKTLQHMGRLPKKGRFHYRLSNLKFFNNLLNIADPNIMG